MNFTQTLQTKRRRRQLFFSCSSISSCASADIQILNYTPPALAWAGSSLKTIIQVSRQHGWSGQVDPDYKAKGLLIPRVCVQAGIKIPPTKLPKLWRAHLSVKNIKVYIIYTYMVPFIHISSSKCLTETENNKGKKASNLPQIHIW